MNTEQKKAISQEIVGLLSESERVVILSHVRPDGDAIGSQLALGWVLERMGKKVTYWNEGPMPESLEFLPGYEKIVFPADHDYDRLGSTVIKSINEDAKWVTIDHHISNEGYGDVRLLDGAAPATGELIYDLIREEDLPFPDEAVQNLYVAISTDTGSFQYDSTTAHTYEVAADLVRRGLDVARINELTYMNHSVRRVELMKVLLNSFTLSAEGRLGDVILKIEDKESIGHLVGDGEGLIDVIRGIDTVMVAVWFEELKDGMIRVSTRSKDHRVNVSEICQQFGGGGHKLAAGIRMLGPINEARVKVLSAIESALP